MRQSHPKIRYVLLLLTLATLSACRDPVVASYRTPKEKSPDTSAHPTFSNAPAAVAGAAEIPATSAPPPVDTSMANTAVATASGAGLTWSAPAHWTAKPASAMRKATYTLCSTDSATAEIAITAFPGDVGGELANINRWRGQLSLPPLVESEVAGAVTRLEHSSLRIAVVDFIGTASNPPTRMLGAIIPVGNATWFFKLTGPDTLVASEKPAFLTFLQSVKKAP